MSAGRAAEGEARRSTLGNRFAPPRFVVFLLLLPLGLAGWRWRFPATGWQDALAMGFDLAAVAFLVSLWPLRKDASVEAMRRHSAQNDANRPLILILTSVLALVVMAAISGELDAAQAGDHWALARLIGTLALIWLFANAVYALHYAHAWYSAGTDAECDCKGIAFPETETPGYSDFAYFACTIGMTFQTSDVQITSPALRRVALLHSIAAFVFNIGVIAFTINAVGG